MVNGEPEDHYHTLLAEKHVQGANNSPFISTLLDPAKGAMITDPWLQGIIQNPNNSLYVLRVPNHLVYYPNWSLSQAETEVLVLSRFIGTICRWESNKSFCSLRK